MRAGQRMAIRRAATVLAALCPLVLAACTSAPGPTNTADITGSGAGSAAPKKATAVCGKLPRGPVRAPHGAVTVDPSVPGDLMTKTEHNPPGTTFWLPPGTYRLGGDPFDQVAPKAGDTYLGAPGAVLDGMKVNKYAFTGHAGNVKIEYLTVRNFVAPRDEGVVNHDSGNGWVIAHDTVEHNDGAGLMAGAHQQVLGDCLRDNGQYGMNAYQDGNGITGLVVRGNEIVGNNTGDWERRDPGCGCTGGIKFWAVNGADIQGNWVHGNHGVGLWADTNNNDFLIANNVIEGNESSAIIYEISYNVVIRDNLIRRNNWVEGKKYAASGDDFPYAAIYISESGGEPRIPARTHSIDISGNLLENNWSGITLWENADRFCNSPANTSSGTCTLLVPKVSQCAQPQIATSPLYDDCRWKTQNVDIHDNRFALDPSVVGCTTLCGRMALLSNYGTYPDWSPYRGDKVEQAITFHQNDRWHDNDYIGPWSFIAHDASRILSEAQWRDAPYSQDKNSTFARGPGN